MANILIFSVDYFPYAGGAEIAVSETCARIPGQSFVMITCWNDRALPREEMIGNIRVFRVGIGIRAIDKYIMPVTAFFAARKLHRASPFSIAWAIMANTGAIAAFLFTRINRNARYLLTLQEGDSEAYYARRTWFWAPLYRALHARADHIHAISGYCASRARRYGYRGAISIIPNGIDSVLFNPSSLSSSARDHARSVSRALSGERIIFTASRLEEKNGVDILLRAYALFSAGCGIPSRLVIAGTGTEEASLKRLARSLGISGSVSFLGYLPHAEMVSVLKSADIFVRPSRSEGLGNAFLEALACGIPAIGTPVGGIPDFLADGITGLLSRTEDPASLADCMKRGLFDSSLRDALISGGLAAVREKYDWHYIAPKISAMLISLSAVSE